MNVKWLSEQLVLKLHYESIHRFGGSHGLRDEGLLESALSRAMNLHAYAPESTLSDLAAATGYGILRNHPFVDGNKRIALMCIYTFLGSNGFRLACSEEEACAVILSAAAGEIDEESLRAWIERSIQPR